MSPHRIYFGTKINKHDAKLSSQLLPYQELCINHKTSFTTAADDTFKYLSFFFFFFHRKQVLTFHVNLLLDR